jgi:soluble lytic murein transglycosylase-like protein
MPKLTLPLLVIALRIFPAAPPKTPSDTTRIGMVKPTAQDTIETLVSMLLVNGVKEEAKRERARSVAHAVKKYAARNGISPVLVVGVIAVENRELKPAIRNGSGAVGIMQVMPRWKRDIKDCGLNLRNIDTNICMGVRILKLSLTNRSTRKGLYRYNGCSRGEKSRTCRKYASAAFERAWEAERAQVPPAFLTLER